MTDKKITELTATTTLLGTDIVPVVSDPGGSPITKKITLTNLIAAVKTAGGAVKDGEVTNASLATDVKAGSLAALTTVDKSSLQAAINEINALLNLVIAINVTTDATGSDQPIGVYWELTSGVAMVDWGDGYASSSASSVHHTYTASGTKLFKILRPAGGWAVFTKLWISAPGAAVDISFSPMTALTNYHASNMATLTPIPDLSTAGAGLVFYSENSETTAYNGGLATNADIKILYAADNGLSEAEVDAILADLVTSLALPGRVVCVVHLGGSNAAPSVTGAADVATLQAAGWAVTVTA
jgi:hypothetical protein